MKLSRTAALLLLILVAVAQPVLAQTPCTTLGQNPSTAFPVCGTTTFHQNNVPICSSNDLFVPGCSGSGNADYENKNPFWYKFTCYQSGTLSFIISPANPNDDYDWQLYDITGLDPDAVYTNRNIIVAGNWSATPGNTGASPSGFNGIQCASDPSEGKPTFSRSPNLVAGHEYILLVSHYTNSQSGYDLSFGGGTAVITDPKAPHMDVATASCDGTKITLKLNKKMKCASLTASGSEFSLLPANATVTNASTRTCATGFDMDEVELTLSNPLPTGSYQLVIGAGTDGTTLADNCDRQIPAGEQVAFTYTTPRPIPIQRVEVPACKTTRILFFFEKKINCATIAADGSNFTITGPTAVNVISAAGTLCQNGLTEGIVVTVAAPFYTKGTYTLTPRLSPGGGAVQDECGQIIQPSPITFNTADTVNADYNFTNRMGCRFDTLTFSHNGAHDVNSWRWVVDNIEKSNTQNYTVILPASSKQEVKLVVHNGVCSDSVAKTIVLNNEVKADFQMPADICPEDKLSLVNTSKGLIDIYSWDFGALGSSNAETPGPLSFIQDNRERSYTIRLRVNNIALDCTDEIRKNLRVLNNCYIAVPTGFTPNGDGLNDYLFPNNALKADNMRFSVFNRWGQMVFSTANWQEKWDGRVNGQPQPAGVYVWFLSYTHRDTGEKILQKGTSTLIR
jgi:gliding motility-associated-like protein